MTMMLSDAGRVRARWLWLAWHLVYAAPEFGHPLLNHWRGSAANADGDYSDKPKRSRLGGFAAPRMSTRNIIAATSVMHQEAEKLAGRLFRRC
ncbi:protein of unknown function [Paraburkholderia dioscoreae]|uniref:Uncharacterized protein n=1 Tax=Paraburkholderia dioscoreae TaxID=2604047 RepID=A0A5Q4YSR5_9BURK|nr:protein of unknown function [Paraburkholderia dioscoreae]